MNATLYDLDRDALERLLVGEPSYRIDQIWRGLYEQGAPLSDLSNVPRALRTQLAEQLPDALIPTQEQSADGGDTVKWLWRLRDGALVETVLMLYPDRATVCISTQAGCAPWGAGSAQPARRGSTGTSPRERSSSRWPWLADAALRRAGCRTSCSWGWANRWRTTTQHGQRWSGIQGAMGISARHLTISTVGIVPGIRRLASAPLPVNLAISLHAANDELRDELVPINTRYPLTTLATVAQEYLDAKGRRLSFEWAMIAGTNDRPRDVAELAGLCRAARGARQPDPPQSHTRLPHHWQRTPPGSLVPRRARAGGGQRNHPPESRPVHRCRLRPVAGGTRRGRGCATPTSLRVVSRVAVAAAFLLLVGACSASPTVHRAATDDPPAETAPAPSSGSLTWRPCTFGECAELTVPLDHAAPEGPTISVTINRFPAENPSERMGVLLVNPGGPGASGLGLAASFAAAGGPVAEHFDLIGFDPRGVGASTPLSCGSTMDAYYRLDPSPDNQEEYDTLAAAARSIAQECEATDGELLPHLHTQAVAADMDLIRQALGEDQINYLGFSYGTAIGLAYASAFGTNLRSLVLDGVVDPTHDLEEYLTLQAVSSEAGIAAVLAACGRDCPIADPRAALDAAFAAAEAGELSGPDGPVSPGEVGTGVLYTTYSESLWPLLWSALADAERGDGHAFAELTTRYLMIADITVYTAVTCIDTPRPEGPEAFEAFVRRAEQAAPLVGADVANDLLPCAFWPAPAVDHTGPINAPEAPPTLVVGNTGDSATPYQQAIDVAAALPNATLLTLEADAHTAYFASACIRGHVDTYLVELTLPPQNTTC